jgi:dihydropteroate synthase
MKKKSKLFYFYITDIRTPAANILKQDLLSIGAELVVSQDSVACSKEFTDGLMIVNQRELELIIMKLKQQPFSLKELALELKSFLIKESYSRVQLMGIVNINSDSFYAKSRFTPSSTIRAIEKMIDDGANIIDIGGVSSRPGSEYVGEDEEFKRVSPIIDNIYKEKLFNKVSFSLDSFSPRAVEYALDRGFNIVNDITALSNGDVAKAAAQYGATVVLMHKLGDTKTMQENPTYSSVLIEVEDFFKEAIERANNFGIKDIILDVGIGFGKRVEDNLMLIKHLEHFKKLGLPLMIGASRKSLIDHISPSNVEDRLAGTLLLHQISVTNGASIIRCHDIYEHRQMLDILEAFNI